MTVQDHADAARSLQREIDRQDRLDVLEIKRANLRRQLAVVERDICVVKGQAPINLPSYA